MSYTFNPLSGKFDYYSDSRNFSFNNVSTDDVVEIESGQTMLTYPQVIVEGELDVDGILLIDPFIDTDTDTKNWSFNQVDQDQELVIPAKQQMLVFDSFNVDGQLTVEGLILIDPFIDTDTDNDTANFSYGVVSLDTSLTIQAGQQMLYEGTIEVNGQLNIEGELCYVSEPDGFLPYWNITTGNVVRLSENKQMAIFEDLIIDGQLIVEGKLLLVS